MKIRKSKIDGKLKNIAGLLFFFIFISGVQFLFAGGLSTSDFNYINDLIGGRATGLGGAYTAISDDPSGAYYNPAGIVFAFDNQISLSVNSYKNKYIEISEVVAGKPYAQNIESFYPSFFGVVQTLGKLKVGITIINYNNEILDQDEYFSGFKLKLKDDPNFYPATFNINYNITDNTLLGGITLAGFATDSMSIGLTVYGLRRRKEEIANQVITFDKTTETTYEWSNTYLTELIYGVTSVLGIQIMPTSTIALGLSFTGGTILSHNKAIQRYLKEETNTGDVTGSDFTFSKSEIDYTDSELPYIVRGGIAWFPSKRMLLTADVIAHIGVKYYQESVQNTINGAVGIEYYVTASFPVRLGLFTNFANTPVINPGDAGREMNVDLYGASLGLSWQTKNSSINLSGFAQYGTGKMQVFGDTGIQDTSVLMYSISLTGSARY